MSGCWMLSVARPFALCRKRCRWPNKMKVKNCVHVNTSHISVMPRNRTTNRLAPPVSTSFSSVSPPLTCNWLCNAFLTFYWLSRQLAVATDCGNWQQASGNSDAHNASMLHPLKCKYLTTILSSRPCLAGSVCSVCFIYFRWALPIRNTPILS